MVDYIERIKKKLKKRGLPLVQRKQKRKEKERRKEKGRPRDI